MKLNLKKLDWSKALKNIGILLAVIVIVCAIGCVLFPFLTWLLFPTSLQDTILYVFALFFIIGIIYAFIPKARGKKYWFFVSIGCFAYLALAVYRYGLSPVRFHGDKIMINDRYSGNNGLANKWGFTVIPCEDNQWEIYAVKNKETNKSESIGMSWNENVEECDGYYDENSSEYRLEKCERILFIYSGENLVKLDTVSLFSVDLILSSSRYLADFTKDEDKTSLYEYIESNYGRLQYDYSGDGFEKLKNCYLRQSPRRDNADEGYVDLGETTFYCDLGGSRELNYYWKGHLFVKSFEGEHFYYVHFGGKKNLLSKGSWNVDGKRFNAMWQSDDAKYYLNVSAWSSAGSEGSSSSGGSSHVVIEHSGPRQEWVPCPACGNSLRVGQCQNCNGTGQDLYYTRSYRDCPTCGGNGRCNMCAGQGGHYETRY